MASWPELPLTMVLEDGNTFDPLDPDPGALSIRVIARALSRIPRFSGHTVEFYSVAQHSVFVANLLPPELQIAGLLHDAHEALSGFMDVSAPFKQRTPFIRTVEASINRAIADRFNIDFASLVCPEINEADAIACATEIRDLMAPTKHQWPDMPSPASGQLQPLSMDAAENVFYWSYKSFGGRYV